MIQKMLVWMGGSLFAAVIVTLFMVTVGNATPLATLDSKTISDSEDTPWERRIYSYDMDIDSNGNVHIVYLKPTTANSADIYYSSRISGVWSQQKLTASGLKGSISTYILVDDSDKVHVCYIKDDDHLYYRTIVNTYPSPEVKVQDGGWHTRMQLDENNQAVFVRGRNGSVRKIDVLTTTDGLIWSQQYWNLPSLDNNLRLSGFVYANGVYHVIYGDSAISKPVVTGGSGTFHNLHYASSSDGVNWSDEVVDTSGTLYENEFWTSLLVDGENPVVSWYQYAEYGGEYNTGTSAWQARRNGSSWQKTNMTAVNYSATREGMGVGLVRYSTNNYFGGWDYSPDNTYDENFRGARGNMVLKLSGTDGAWKSKWQLTEYSAEGEVKLRIKNNRLFFLALGDFVDAKLYFKEYDMNLFFSPAPPPPPPHDSGAILAPIATLLLRD